MSEAFEDLNRLDRLVHHPGRLTILTILDACRSADFLFLASATGLPNGNLSSHLSRLEEAGLIAIEKSFRHKRPHTEVSLTSLGRDRVTQYWQSVDEARKTAMSWRRVLSTPAIVS